MPLRRATLEDYEQRLLRAQQLLERRLDDEVTPAELAHAASFSLHHFHRIFRAQLGETVMQRVRRLRLERAARRVRDSQARLIELALEAGYESHEAFTRAFAEHFGVPPSEYREEPSPRRGIAAKRAPRIPISVRELEAVPVAFIRHHGSYDGVGKTWQKLVAWAAAEGLFKDDFRVLYGICPDDTDVTPEQHLRFDASVALAQPLSAAPGIGSTTVPAGTYAIGVHIGPYESLRETYLEVVGHWFPTSGYEPAPEPVIEHYLNDPMCTPAHELRTEVRVRIADH
ncbi:MAG TPA: AraC family transcriptional regulator [Polyangiales bacterium]|nr:AraC family transcriptional regulator [Polyangiales bacterium]